MTKDDFNSLNEDEQLQLVFDFGIDVADRVTEDYQITLFQLFSFYVEIYTSAEKWLCEIRGFDETQYLNIYISEIDLAAILD